MFDPANGLWTWLRGSSAINSHGNYVGLGVAAGANDPGARGGSSFVTDEDGYLWLIGGMGNIPSDALSAPIQDVWKYNPSNNLWTILKGSDRATAVFGTLGVPDAANNPGARRLGTCGTDGSGNIWLFGGNGSNDLWRYNIAGNVWTWMKGSNSLGNPVYGIKGITDAFNTPSARDQQCGFSDRFGRFWIYGGNGIDAAGTSGVLGDLWMFDPRTNNWTWIEGSNVISVDPVFAAPGVNAGNDPGARFESGMVLDNAGPRNLFSARSRQLLERPHPPRAGLL